MPRFIQILQIIIAVVIGAVVGYDLILNGISILMINTSPLLVGYLCCLRSHCLLSTN